MVTIRQSDLAALDRQMLPFFGDRRESSSDPAQEGSRRMGEPGSRGIEEPRDRRAAGSESGGAGLRGSTALGRRSSFSFGWAAIFALAVVAITGVVVWLAVFHSNLLSGRKEAGGLVAPAISVPLVPRPSTSFPTTPLEPSPPQNIEPSKDEFPPPPPVVVTPIGVTTMGGGGGNAPTDVLPVELLPQAEISRTSSEQSEEPSTPAMVRGDAASASPPALMSSAQETPSADRFGPFLPTASVEVSTQTLSPTSLCAAGLVCSLSEIFGENILPAGVRVWSVDPKDLLPHLVGKVNIKPSLITRSIMRDDDTGRPLYTNFLMPWQKHLVPILFYALRAAVAGIGKQKVELMALTLRSTVEIIVPKNPPHMYKIVAGDQLNEELGSRAGRGNKKTPSQVGMILPAEDVVVATWAEVRPPNEDHLTETEQDMVRELFPQEPAAYTGGPCSTMPIEQDPAKVIAPVQTRFISDYFQTLSSYREYLLLALTNAVLTAKMTSVGRQPMLSASAPTISSTSKTNMNPAPRAPQWATIDAATATVERALEAFLKLVMEHSLNLDSFLSDDFVQAKVYGSLVTGLVSESSSDADISVTLHDSSEDGRLETWLETLAFSQRLQTDNIIGTRGDHINSNTAWLGARHPSPLAWLGGSIDETTNSDLARFYTTTLIAYIAKLLELWALPGLRVEEGVAGYYLRPALRLYLAVAGRDEELKVEVTFFNEAASSKSKWLRTEVELHGAQRFRNLLTQVKEWAHGQGLLTKNWSSDGAPFGAGERNSKTTTTRLSGMNLFGWTLLVTYYMQRRPRRTSCLHFDESLGATSSAPAPTSSEEELWPWPCDLDNFVRFYAAFDWANTAIVNDRVEDFLATGRSPKMSQLQSHLRNVDVVRVLDPFTGANLWCFTKTLRWYGTKKTLLHPAGWLDGADLRRPLEEWVAIFHDDAERRAARSVSRKIGKGRKKISKPYDEGLKYNAHYDIYNKALLRRNTTEVPAAGAVH